MAKFSPMHDNVLVRPVAQAERSAGGLYLPPSTVEGQRRGEVIATGPGYYENGTWVTVKVKEGTEILFPTHGTVEIEIEGEKLFLVKAKSILGSYTTN